MEKRKITVVSTTTQTKKTFLSEATTLGELKKDLTDNGIDFTDMDFFEGTSKTELVSDSSMLPHDINYKGIITNELVFLLTKAKRKYKSGILPRQELYRKIKEGNLQVPFRESYNKSFTQAKSTELEEFLSKAEHPVCNPETAVLDRVASFHVADLLSSIMEAFYECGWLTVNQCDTIKMSLNDILRPKKGNLEGPASSYSDEEIQEMIDGLIL